MSKSSIILITLSALVLGALIGISFVDETAEAPVDPAPTDIQTAGGGAPVFRYLNPDRFSAVVDESGRPAPTTVGENFVSRNEQWKSETLVIDIGGDGGVEYKALMAQGDAIVFTWKTDSGPVYYDFHAHDEAFGDQFFTRYDEGESREASGSIVAPYKGQHGWYWLNLEAEPITISLTVAGFYDKIIKLQVNGD